MVAGPAAGKVAHVGQTNVNAGGTGGDGGFGAGMIIGIVLLIVIVLVLVFYAGPQVINVNVNQKSLLDMLIV
jgi:hypothetical protein